MTEITTVTVISSYNCCSCWLSEARFYFYFLLGTPFMVRLHKQLKFFVNYKYFPLVLYDFNAVVFDNLHF